MLNYGLYEVFGGTPRLQSIWLYIVSFWFSIEGLWGLGMGILRRLRETFCQSNQLYLWLSYLVFNIIVTVVPKLIFLNIRHIPEGEHRASPPLFPLQNKSRWSLCWWNSWLPLQLCFIPVAFPLGNPKIVMEAGLQGWSWPGLSGCLPKGIFMKILLCFFLIRAFSFVIRAHAKLCSSPSLPFFHNPKFFLLLPHQEFALPSLA